MPVHLAYGGHGRTMKENINGTEICYRIEGEGNNRVLLLHGWGCDMKLMQPVADALKTDHRTLAVDFPGHGESGRPPEPWGVPEYAACLRELLKRLSFTPCSVIAHSFGARVAAWLEAEEPGLFNRIVFTGGAGIRPKPSEESKARAARYKKLKGYCETAKKIPLLGKAAENIKGVLFNSKFLADFNSVGLDMQNVMAYGPEAIDVVARCLALKHISINELVEEEREKRLRREAESPRKCSARV